MSEVAVAQRAEGLQAPRAFATGAEQTFGELRAAPLRTRPRPSLLEAPITALRGAGPKLAGWAAELGIETVGELLRHVPHGYRDRATIRPLAELRIGEEATVLVEVRSARVRPTRRRNLRILEAAVADASGPIKAIWFNQAYLADRLTPGTRVLLNGTLEPRGFKVAAHEVISGDGSTTAGAGIHTTGLVPMHPASQRLKAHRIREWAWQAMEAAPLAIEPLPAELRARRGFPCAADALRAVHFPRDLSEARVARERLAFEELLLHQLALALRRSARRAARPGIEIGSPAPGGLVERWLASLPFEPTADQRAAFADLDAELGAGEPMQRLLMGEVGSGKAQPLDAGVLTPCGFRPMGTISLGDAVVAPTGEVTKVVGVFPQGERDVWRVRFSDGTAVECDAEHLWQVRTSQARCLGWRPKVKPLREIAADLFASNGAAKWHVELPTPADLDDGGERPLDPYLLGLLLGDGGMTIPDRVRFTSADSELVDAVRASLPPGCRLTRDWHRPYDWKVVSDARSGYADVLRRVRRGDHDSMVRAYKAGASQQAIANEVGRSRTAVRYQLLKRGVRMRAPFRRNALIAALGSLGLMEKGARDKLVPSSYLCAPVADRHALLQGLLDSDGTLNRQGLDVSFTSASERLAHDVAWLVRSLGGRAVCRSRVKAGNTYWFTSVILPEAFLPFRLRRKADRLRSRSKYAHPAKALVAVEYVGRKAVQCIAVAHPDQLYITDGFTVTHNTVVAVYAMLRALEAGHQAALMAPTETLAEQHAVTLDRLLASEAVPFALLTGATTVARRREMLARLGSGELGLVVGTHALIEPDVGFASLALCVVDEQHRFGVSQRAALDAKGPGGAAPHVLHMTATPIPRTLSLTAYGDLDSTTIRELPAGRRPVKTWVVGEEKRAAAYGYIRERLREGRQAYVVCPLVVDSEKLQAKAADAEAERLARGEFADFSVGLLHGQMSSRDKAAAMEEFVGGGTDVLVATTVIEVGIDVANATVMLIEGAERYGLSQLHQLRGRVGRGRHESQCILFSDPESELARRRMEAIAGSCDGFELAEVDLALRGEGEILGTRQSGLPRFRVAVLPDDASLLVEARREVLGLLRDGDLSRPELGPLLAAARERFGDERSAGIAA